MELKSPSRIVSGSSRFNGNLFGVENLAYLVEYVDGLKLNEIGAEFEGTDAATVPESGGISRFEPFLRIA
jgi:hypothetical protein